MLVDLVSMQTRKGSQHAKNAQEGRTLWAIQVQTVFLLAQHAHRENSEIIRTRGQEENAWIVRTESMRPVSGQLPAHCVQWGAIARPRGCLQRDAPMVITPQ